MCAGFTKHLSPHPVQASPSAAAPKVATSMASSPCYTDPTQDSCASFKQTESDSLADINILCSSMPNMVGCTVFRECEVRGGVVHVSLQAHSCLNPQE